MRQATPSQKRAGFRAHALVFVPTLALLAVINLYIGPPYWVLWVVLGWTIGIVSHWWFALGPGSQPDRMQ